MNHVFMRLKGADMEWKVLNMYHIIARCKPTVTNPDPTRVSLQLFAIDKSKTGYLLDFKAMTEEEETSSPSRCRSRATSICVQKPKSDVNGNAQKSNFPSVLSPVSPCELDTFTVFIINKPAAQSCAAADAAYWRLRRHIPFFYVPLFLIHLYALCFGKISVLCGSVGSALEYKS
uniref:Uncharacterized protein n=1 Tax=Caenorhabditis japonica TaxID=281687 RepID=A0A8R1E6B4_CAEJA